MTEDTAIFIVASRTLIYLEDRNTLVLVSIRFSDNLPGHIKE
jgi:hypothetical protein